MPSTAWKDLVSDDELEKAAKNRRLKKRRIKCKIGEEEEWADKGYSVVSSGSNTRSVVMEYVLNQSELFENSVWLLLHSFGFKFMNKSEDFGIPYTDDPEINPKQIDVFASDEKVALVIECKSADVGDDEPRKSKSFKKDFESIRSMMDYQSREIRGHFDNQNLQVGFVFFTRGYTIGEADRQIAKHSNIVLLDENDMKYYQALYKALGVYAKNQVLCNIFESTPIPGMSVKVPAIRGKLDNYDFYTMMVHPSQILDLVYVSTRKPNSTDQDDSYQRLVKKEKLKEIREFIQKGGFFSNSIIINIDCKHQEPIFTPDKDGPIASGTLELPPYFMSLWIIDGQHRLFSYYGTKEAETAIVPISAFVNLETDIQS